MKLSAFSIILIFVCLTLAGIAFVPLLPLKLSPSQALPQINVRFNMTGSASRVVEMEATSKLEGMLARIKGVENIHSISHNGWGEINVRFNKHTNLDAARFEASTIIRQIWPFLPQNVSYPYISLSRSNENAGKPFLSFTVNAPANPIVIQQYTENTIKPKLAQIAGVNRIDVSGAMPMQWKGEYDYLQLFTLGLTIYDIQQAIQSYLNREFLGTASIVDDKGNTQWIRIALVAGDEGQRTAFNPKDITVKNVEGKLITLDKVVNFTRLEQEATSYYRINGLNSVYMSITADENANQLDLSQKVKKQLKELQPVFPTGYEIHTGYDASEYIQKELDKIYFRAGLSLAILLLFVLIIYRSFNYLLMIVLSLLMNTAVAVILFYFAGLEIQLYSLAGITISLTLVNDNIIVMSDQIIRRRNMNAFTAILTTTLTIVASLVIIFFMDERIRLNLQDFAWVVILNLAVSLFVSLFLVPALIEKLKIGERRKNPDSGTWYSVTGQPATGNRNGIARVKGDRRRYIKFVLYFNRFYAAFCRFIWRWKIPVCIIVILLFGLPVFLLPEKMEGESKWDKLYNETIGTTFYKEKVKPYVDVALGGTLRLFVQKVFEGSYFTDRQETSLYVTATLPNGSTVEQMNNLIQRMEAYISQFPEVRIFQTSIYNARRADISIQFTKEGERTGFPYMLKSKLISRSLELGGGSWNVVGLGDGFSNDVRESAGSYRVLLWGTNYDELIARADQFKSKLLERRRIKEVTIGSEFSWFKDDYEEYAFDLNRERLAQENIQPVELFSSLGAMFGRNIYSGQLQGVYGTEQIMLQSKQSGEYDIWDLKNVPEMIGKNKTYKINELATLTKGQAPQKIVKENQRYRLCLQYEYIGAYEQGRKVLDEDIKEFKTKLPMGYTIEKQDQGWNWGKDNKKQYVLLLLIFVIIYFTCSILFDSMRQPFAVIFVIPIAYIGIFLTFYFFKLNFDQGGFAAFIMLCGLAVNKNVYVLDEYNNIRKKRKISPLKAYIKAWNAKISPIFLTLISTALGFVPFLIGTTKEAFWFPLAAGTIGGLIVSLFGTFCFLPLFMGVGKKH
jgi:multidrug efflux pump subunit AcrB